MKIKALGLSVVALVAMGAALQAGGQDDKANIQGTWKIDSLKFAGKDLPNPGGDEGSVTFKDGKMVMKGKEDQGGSYTIDATKKPKHIDLDGLGGPKGGGKMPGIYELDGDTLKIGIGMPKFDMDDEGGIKITPPDRPKTFGDGMIILVLKRAKG